MRAPQGAGPAQLKRQNVAVKPLHDAAIAPLTVTGDLVECAAESAVSGLQHLAEHRIVTL